MPKHSHRFSPRVANWARFIPMPAHLTILQTRLMQVSRGPSHADLRSISPRKGRQITQIFLKSRGFRSVKRAGWMIQTGVLCLTNQLHASRRRGVMQQTYCDPLQPFDALEPQGQLSRANGRRVRVYCHGATKSLLSPIHFAAETTFFADRSARVHRIGSQSASTAPADDESQAA